MTYPFVITVLYSRSHASSPGLPRRPLPIDTLNPKSPLFVRPVPASPSLASHPRLPTSRIPSPHPFRSPLVHCHPKPTGLLFAAAVNPELRWSSQFLASSRNPNLAADSSPAMDYQPLIIVCDG